MIHPILAKRRNLALYLAAWAPIVALMVYLIGASKRVSWFEATVVVLILCTVYQFVCLSAWYSCRMTPIEGTSLSRIWLTHSTAAVVLSFLWMELARGVTYALSRLPSFAGLDERFNTQLPLVFGAGILLYLLAVASHYVVLAVAASHEAEARALETSVLARDAELKALKAQINPHFLFNSLNSISALTSIDPGRAREMCLLLADFLRTTLKLGEKVQIPLSEELGLLERFLAIEKVRFGTRLNTEMKIEDNAMRCLVPTLLLQPLVENAVGHGIAKLTDGGVVKLTAANHSGRLAIVVENSMDPDAPPSRKGGVGLRNVQERLEARYGKEASLRATADEDVFRVNLTMPAEVEEKL
ncbi:MAG TPA: histidine kinase [Candidatus Acidoferrum sp.]|nr:histidine kinase [Candidatus Acidoferrum sp.]